MNGTEAIADATTVCQYTDGFWQDEDAAKAELDARLLRCVNLFAVHPEVTGYYLQPRYLTSEKAPRIDRLLVPKARLIDAGWTYGVIGVECKRSGMKLGPVIAQCQDYGRAVFKSKLSSVSVACEWVFIWPLQDVRGDLASVMTQNRIGGLFAPRCGLLNFKTACGTILDVRGEQDFRIGRVAAGCKVGSR